MFIFLRQVSTEINMYICTHINLYNINKIECINITEDVVFKKERVQHRI